MSNKIISGALFDFMGWLTSRPKRIMLSSVDNASPAVEAIKDFAKMRGLSLDDARVQDWQEALAEQPRKQEPVAWMYEDMMGLVGVRVQKEKPIVARPVTPLYTSPQPVQRQARGADTLVGLTDDEIDELSRTMVKGNKSVNGLCRAIEATLKEKNT